MASRAVQWRPVKHRLFSIVAALSLLLFVAVVVLWVRSYWVRDEVEHESFVTTMRINSGGGRLGYERFVLTPT